LAEGGVIRSITADSTAARNIPELLLSQNSLGIHKIVFPAIDILDPSD
jgi:hypothetical protein